MSMFAGGIKYPVQTFNKQATGTSATVCVMASIAITIPAVTVTESNSNAENHLSVGVSVVLIVCYCVMLVFSLVTHKHLYDVDGPEDEKKEKPDGHAIPLDQPDSKAEEDETQMTQQKEHDIPKKSSRSGTLDRNATLAVFSKPTIPKDDDERPHDRKDLYKAIAMLCVASCFVAWMSEILVGAVEQAGEAIGVSKIFMGVIIVAIVGNAAEHSTAVVTAYKNHMDVSINIALGSALQIAMFVGPVLVLCSYARETPMSLVFTSLEVFAVFLSLVIVWMVVQDGESTWMEGFLLMMLYIILALAFLFLASDEGAE